MVAGEWECECAGGGLREEGVTGASLRGVSCKTTRCADHYAPCKSCTTGVRVATGGGHNTTHPYRILHHLHRL
jgi:hypothetical protein